MRGRACNNAGANGGGAGFFSCCSGEPLSEPGLVSGNGKRHPVIRRRAGSRNTQPLLPPSRRVCLQRKRLHPSGSLYHPNGDSPHFRRVPEQIRHPGQQKGQNPLPVWIGATPSIRRFQKNIRPIRSLTSSRPCHRVPQAVCLMKIRRPFQSKPMLHCEAGIGKHPSCRKARHRYSRQSKKLIFNTLTRL